MYSNEMPTEMLPLYNFILVGLIPVLLIGGLITILVFVVYWKVYKKAGKPGWAALIPIYNTIVLLEIAGLPIWYFILSFIPIANIYFIFKLYIELAHKFGKSTGFGIALVFFPVICFPILAFSKKIVYVNGSNEVQENNMAFGNPQPSPMGSVNAMQNDMNNGAMNFATSAPEPVMTNPVEMPIQNPVPQENNMAFGNPQPSPMGSVNAMQNDMNNGAMNFATPTPEPVMTNPVEMPIQNQAPQENNIVFGNPQPSSMEYNQTNNNQNSGLM